VRKTKSVKASGIQKHRGGLSKGDLEEKVGLREKKERGEQV